MRKVFLEGLPKKRTYVDWKKCAELKLKVKFIYGDLEGWIEIVDYNKDINNSKYYLTTIYNNKILKIETSNFKNGCLGNLLNKNTSDFKVEIGQVFKDDRRDLIITDRVYRIEYWEGKKYNKKYYIYTCNKCGWTEGWVKESNLLAQEQGCPACCHNPQTVVRGINDVATTHPHLIKYFVSIEDAYKYTYCSNKKIQLKCIDVDYHIYEGSVANLYNECGCPYCNTSASGKFHPKDSLGQIIIDNYGKVFLNKIWSNKNDKSAFEYSIGSGEKVFWNCENGKHKEYLRSVYDMFRCNFRCPNCVRERQESFLQEKVRLYIEKIGNFVILHEQYCTIVPINPKTKCKLPFDNEIKELKLIIEVNGSQHYKKDKFAILNARKNKTTPEQEFRYQQLKDRYKRICAKSQGYEFLEIPYWTDDKEETWKKLINEKISTIKTKIN